MFLNQIIKLDFRSTIMCPGSNCYQSDFNVPGSYVCSFNGTRDLASIDSATRIHIYVFDEIHLLTHSGETMHTMHRRHELINLF